MNPSQDAGRIPGAVVAHRFVWPYGGRRAFLSGSFTRWLEHIPMSPSEDCPTLFQVVCSLMPGIHQYKFCVDGEWRYDERQPYISGDYGIVNTLAITQAVDSILPSPGTSVNRMNMDVDIHSFQPMEANFGITEADIATTAQKTLSFLSDHTAYELLPDSGKVVALDINLPVKQAFHILHEQGISVAPLWDTCTSQFVGMLTALDFILILQELGNRGPSLTEEELETHTISAWKGVKQQLARQLNPHVSVYHKQLAHAGPHDSLKDVAVKILQAEVATIPIIYSSSHDGSFPQLLHLATLAGILKCICRYFRNSYSSSPILQQPICNISLGTWVPKIGQSSRRPLAMLRPTASLSSALSLLIQAQVSSIPIVDENDSLLDIYSRSDIIALAKDKIYAHVRLNEISIQQALQLGQGANSPCGSFNGQRCQMCLPSDLLFKIMERLANPGVRRLIIVEAGSKRVEGIISLSDVFRFLFGTPRVPTSNA